VEMMVVVVVMTMTTSCHLFCDLTDEDGSDERTTIRTDGCLSLPL
jgi:hypothetical protein